MQIPKAARLALPFVVIAASTHEAKKHHVGRVEKRAFQLVNSAPDHIRGPVWLVMQSGSLAAVFTLAALVRRRDQATAAKMLVFGTAAWSAAKLIKPLVGRGRPADLLDDVDVRGSAQTGLGFPSGHSAVAATLALLATRPRTPARAAAIGAAVATGLARMYVGAHLPLDVLGGMSIGVVAAQVGRPHIDRTPLSDSGHSALSHIMY